MSYEDMTKRELMEDLIFYEKRNQELEAKIKAIEDELDKYDNPKYHYLPHWLPPEIREILRGSASKARDDNE